MSDLNPVMNRIITLGLKPVKKPIINDNNWLFIGTIT
jgi:hypothetical protein